MGPPIPGRRGGRFDRESAQVDAQLFEPDAHVLVAVLVVPVLVVADELDAGLDQLAARRLGEDEQLARLLQRRHGPFDGGLVLGGGGGMLEAHDVGAGRLQLHHQLIALDRDVEHRSAVLVRAELAGLVGMGRAAGTGRQQDQCASHLVLLVLDRIRLTAAV